MTDTFLFFLGPVLGLAAGLAIYAIAGGFRTRKP